MSTSNARGRRFYVVRQVQGASTHVWVSASCVAEAWAHDEPRGAEWASVYAVTAEGALARAMGRKVRLKWQPYKGVGE